MGEIVTEEISDVRGFWLIKKARPQKGHNFIESESCTVVMETTITHRQQHVVMTMVRIVHALAVDTDELNLMSLPDGRTRRVGLP